MPDFHSEEPHATDVFGGAGGWDVAARQLGLAALGVEWDVAACMTRRAAGLLTVEGDVRDFHPLDFDRVPGFIASPPCQTFSAAGKGAGRAALDTVYQLTKTLQARQSVDFSVLSDERTRLVLEPLRWVLAALDNDRPYEWIAFEQVPTVLPVWEYMAEIFRREGYHVATGKLSAEQYGVPQTRKRAFLIAHLDREVSLPAPTHRPYKRGVGKHEGDQGLLPWLSMADAIGWGMTHRPYPTIASGIAGRPGPREGRRLRRPKADLRGEGRGPLDPQRSRRRADLDGGGCGPPVLPAALPVAGLRHQDLPADRQHRPAAPRPRRPVRRHPLTWRNSSTLRTKSGFPLKIANAARSRAPRSAKRRSDGAFRRRTTPETSTKASNPPTTMIPTTSTAFS